jgi:hypothetical protein
MRWRRRARVVLPLLDGPDIPIMVAFWGGSWAIVSLSVSGKEWSEVKELSRAWRGLLGLIFLSLISYLIVDGSRAKYRNVLILK